MQKKCASVHTQREESAREQSDSIIMGPSCASCHPSGA